MNLGRELARRPLFCALALACAFALPAFAQQKNDESYGAKVKEYTTEKYFLTELVDHLPADARVPSPDKVLGYVVGTPGKLTHTKDLHRYYRELERTSPRVKVFIMLRVSASAIPSPSRLLSCATYLPQ